MNERKIQLTMAMGLLVLGVLGSGQYAAADVQALAQKSGCMACHAVDKKVVGPSYKEVAAKYKDDPKAVGFLSGKVKTVAVVSGDRCRCRPTPHSVTTTPRP